jgi:hypothetical protein
MPRLHTVAQEKRPRQERTFAPVGGITAISRAVHESIQEEASLTSQAFASLNSLIENAKEIVRRRRRRV